MTQLAKIRPEWLDEGEDTDDLYIVLEVNTKAGCAVVTPVFSWLFIKPINTVILSSIYIVDAAGEPTGENPRDTE